MADIDEVLNARRPFLSIPTELLQAIMEFIPDPVDLRTWVMYWPVWHATARDSTMIVPISQTCRRLRSTALGCPSLWKSFPWSPHSRSHQLIQRSQGMPLKVLLPIQEFSTLDLTLADAAADIEASTKELEIANFPYSKTTDALCSRSFRMLESLTIQWTLETNSLNAMWPEGNILLLTKDCAPRLRRLAYSSGSLASLDILWQLTHLALHSVMESRIHEGITTMLSACHALESLHLEGVTDFDHQLNWAGVYRPLPTPSPLLGCRLLRRVALVLLKARLASFILSLLAEQSTLAVQLLDMRLVGDANVSYPPRLLPGGISKAIIGRYPRPSWPSERGPPFVWGITLSSLEHTVRRTGEALTDIIDMLYREGAGSGAFEDVQELWLADVFPTACDGPNALHSPEADQIRALIQCMSGLECVTLVNQFQSPWTGAPSSLRLLPDAREDGRFGPRPATVRIAYGYGEYVVERWSEPRPKLVPAVPPLDLTGILEELATGAYSYIEKLVIEVPRRVDVDMGDIEQRRARVGTVELKVVDSTPTMEFPEYCAEPAAILSDEPWPYRIW